mmetsp:Transcript_15094/g.21065  ORF Transcript_15094/g.21065 Transcript_15094/m.21065 type:complete len:88 (+) Transcript_15094:90-353(+)|eukprot:CAMPEP_0168562128 /NCGR_PEP_ID=MMETSP0413-20121227/11958_1 /TAXON_ID=136452 /ORGANISM="Filamoeba nolandi, Strain NC-AS-23-1" /LENGTH=87 /DNA_ID=CAMNT_0008593535 /DNA_START=53 /DNA_END=316 /DNA_ORIENTATION=-
MANANNNTATSLLEPELHVISNFKFGDVMFIGGSTLVAGIIGYSVAYPRRLKGPAGFTNGLVAAIGSFLVAYVDRTSKLVAETQKQI